MNAAGLRKLCSAWPGVTESIKWEDDLVFSVADKMFVVTALRGFEVVMPRRETFYGSTEIGYREPGGHYVTFAQMKREAA